jgi:hypothetical protein
MIDTYLRKKTRKLQSIPTYNRYQRKVAFAEISDSAIFGNGISHREELLYD